MALRREHGVEGFATEDQIDEILATLGLTVCPGYPFRGQIRAMLLGRTIYLAERMERGERIVAKAHELGHHLLHGSNGFYRASPGHVGGGNRKEDEAHVFAAAVALDRPPASRERIDERMHEAFECGFPPCFLWEWVAALGRGFVVEEGVPSWVYA